MVIIVEGIDRVGKTTLCKKLSEGLNLPIYKHIGDFKYSNMDNDNETDELLQILEICRLTYSFMIFDRFHFTDYIYGIIQRNYNKEKADKNFRILENFLENSLGKTILIFVHSTDIEKSSKEHGKDLSQHEKMFEQLFEESKIKYKLKCDYNSLDETVEKVRKIISESFI